MKHGRTITTALVLSLAAAPAFGDYYVGTAIVDRVPGYYSGSGGEFTLSSTSLDTSAFSSVAKDVYGGSTSFQTFCVETDEYVYPPGDVVKMDLNTSGPTGSQAWKGGKDSDVGDPLNYETAYLFTQFATGNLSNYNYTPGAGRSASAAELQEAIWYLEGEIGSATGQAWTWVLEAQGAGWTDIGSVRVLNLFTSTTRIERQDMLYLVPVPAAALLGMLGLGVAGLKLRKFV